MCIGIEIRFISFRHIILVISISLAPILYPFQPLYNSQWDPLYMCAAPWNRTHISSILQILYSIWMSINQSKFNHCIQCIHMRMMLAYIELYHAVSLHETLYIKRVCVHLQLNWFCGVGGRWPESEQLVFSTSAWNLFHFSCALLVYTMVNWFMMKLVIAFAFAFAFA